MHITNIAGYKFISLDGLSALRAAFMEFCEQEELMGTILLSAEGINISLAGKPQSIIKFKQFLRVQNDFADITFRESFSTTMPFKFLRVKLRKEIITMGRKEICPEVTRAPHISPQEFKQWLDENRDITVLDTRNDYEIAFGAFDKAKDFKLKDFGDFPVEAEKLSRDKPIVMYCTGGIRCEKAGLHLLNAGFPEVYQLDGGILNYFKEIGGEHYQGDCFVFDNRVALNSALQETKAVQCKNCQGPVSEEQQSLPEFISGMSCPACI